MRRAFYILFILFGVCLSANAQELKVINGNGDGVSSVQAFLPAHKPPRVLLGNENGIISVKDVLEDEQIILRCLGYRTDTIIYHRGISEVVLKKENYDLGEVVITAQYRPLATSESVHVIRTIGATEIQERAAINLRDVLQSELNFRVSQDNILGSGLSMQGISGQNVKVMVDGVPVIGRLDGNIDISQINLDQIERVEIVEGPLAVNYGSNALAGTINLITKSPKTNEVNAGADFYTESTGHFNATANAALGWKSQSMSISAGRNYFDGWNPGDDAFFHKRSYIADDTRRQQWKPKEQLFADAKFRQIFKKGYAEIAGSWFNEEIINRGAPRGAYKESALDDKYNTLRYSISGKVQTPLAKRWNMHNLFAYNLYRRTKSTFITDLTGVSSELSSNTSLQDTSAFSNFLGRGSIIGELSKSLQLQIGYEIELETAEGIRIKDETGRIENYALFATTEWKPAERLTIKPGLRWAYNSRYDAPVIPSINFLYRLPLNTQARVSYAQGFRSPGLKELSFFFVDVNHNIVGNQNLRAETSHNVSASITAGVSENRKIGWTVSGFYNRVHNLITLAQESASIYTYVNIGEQETFGGRLNVERSFRNLRLLAGFAYTGISSRIGEEINQGSFLYTPEATFRAGYTFAKAGIGANLIYKYNGRRNFFGSNGNGEVTKEYLEAYQNLDVTVSKKIWKERLGLEVGAKNLFDVQNITATANGGVHSSGSNVSIGTGRTYFVRMTFSITKDN